MGEKESVTKRRKHETKLKKQESRKKKLALTKSETEHDCRTIDGDSNPI